MPIKLTLPTEADLPTGAFGALTAALGRLYLAAGSPGTPSIAQWTRESDAVRDPVDPRRPVGVSHELASRLLQGRSGPKSVTRWVKVHAMADALHRHRMDRDEVLDLDRLHKLWKEVAHGTTALFDNEQVDPNLPVWHQSYTRHATPNTAEHFARAGYAWAYERAGEDPAHLQGAVALAAIHPDPIACRRVFAQDLHYWLDRLADQKILRKDGVGTVGHYEWTTASCIYYCTMQRSDIETFIAIEVSTFGAVSVYFREAINDGSVDELLYYWIRRAWQVALLAAHLLGMRGKAYGATLIPYSGVPYLTAEIDKDLATNPKGWPRMPYHPVLPTTDSFVPILHDPLELVPRSVSGVFPYSWTEHASWLQAARVKRSLTQQFPGLLLADEPSEELLFKIAYR